MWLLSLAGVADAFMRDIPEREFKAQLAAGGALNAVKEARAATERQRLVEEKALAAREAERFRSVEERKQERARAAG